MSRAGGLRGLALRVGSAPNVVARITQARLHRVALAGVLAFSALLEFVNLSSNSWANQYYSAAVKSMLGSLHNFFFVSSDPGGLITVDKPPLGLWLQGASAAIFGFHPLSLLVPEALCAVAAVAAMYAIIAPRCGAWAGVAAAGALAVFPSFVASARDNNLDALLIALMTLACLTGLRAAETGRWRWLLATAVLVGLAFNTKTLAAYLVLPGLAVAWLVCAPVALRRRIAMLAVATLVLAAVSLVWLVIVDATPASQRPYVGGTTNNSELSLSFGHNGFGRVLGERGAPGHIVHVHRSASVNAALGGVGGRAAHAAPAVVLAHAAGAAARTAPVSLRVTGSTSSVGPAGLLRLFDHATGDQGAWLLAFAVIGLIALALVVAFEPPGGRRRDPRLAVALVMGGWFVVEGLVLSFSSGIVHPYYVSALGPGLAAMVGAGAAAFVSLVARRRAFAVLPALAFALTVITAIVLLGREHDYLHWLLAVLVAVAVIVVGAIVLRPSDGAASVGVGVLAALLVPAIYSATVWQVPVDGTFPVAGPYIQDNVDSYGIPPDDVQSYRTLLAYVRPREPGARWDVLTQGSNTAAALILVGGRAAALGGYGTIDPVLSPAALAARISRGQARYVALGGGYASRGGNAASAAVAAACREVPFPAWRSPHNYGTSAHPDYRYPHGGWNLVLYDCAGREHALAAA